MKIIFKTEELLNKLKNLTPTAEAKQTLMILGNAAFKVKDNMAEVTTTDLEIEVSTKLNVILIVIQALLFLLKSYRKWFQHYLTTMKLSFISKTTQ